jgi:hypothetical protein
MPEKTESPADAAAKHALRQRLQEMERAEQLQNEVRQQQVPPQQPAPQQQPAMSPAEEKFLAEHPEFADPTDAVAQAELYTAILKANRDGKGRDQPDFIPTLERYLGLRQPQQQQPRPQPQPSPRYEAPPRQQRPSAPVSAPPHREVPSMTSGRPQSFRRPLTADEVEIARASGITPERYQAEKEKMLRMKAAGEIDDRR